MRGFIFFVLPFGTYSSSCIKDDGADEASLLQVGRVLGKDDPADQHGRTYKDDDDDYKHRINSQAQQVMARVKFATDRDIKIKAETTRVDHQKVPDGYSASGYLEWAKYSQHRVCVGASDDAVADIEDYHSPEFTLDEPLCFNKLNIGYLAGYLNCRNPDRGKSYYGCDEDSIGLVLAKKNDEDNYDVVFPKPVRDGDNSTANKAWNVANIAGYSFMDHSHADWYKLSGYSKHQTHLALKMNKDGEGGFTLAKGDYRLWFHEDLTGGTEGDNSGVACYHLDFELCQGTHDSEWSISTVTAPTTTTTVTAPSE